MSGEESIKYWEAILETIKLIRGLQQYQNEHPEVSKSLTDHLAEIMQKAAAKTGGTSALSQELGLSFITRKPSTYWKAVHDTVSTVHDFILWKEENPTDPRDLDGFLFEFWSKAEQKVRKASPLAQELGMDFLVKSSPPSAPSAPSVASSMPEPAPIRVPAPEPEPAPIRVPAPEPEPAPIRVPAPEPEPAPIRVPAPEPEVEAGPTFPPSMSPREASPPLRVPAPEPIPEPTPVSTPEPITPPPSEEPGIQLSEALLSQLREEEPPTLDEPSLTEELLDTSEEEEDDLLSSSLRAALKMLRDDEEE